MIVFPSADTFFAADATFSNSSQVFGDDIPSSFRTSSFWYITSTLLVSGNDSSLSPNCAKRFVARYAPKMSSTLALVNPYFLLSTYGPRSTTGDGVAFM